ncbi:MAG: hypothetical protein K2Y71_10610 [Xanthobacteraceae bacterium]|nr:hypothetical protein [Xanthobacteraceae bacterium]
MPLPTHVLNEIARLMRDPDALRHERERMPHSGRRGHYDPNQPRVPAGHSGGGQWTDADGDIAGSGLEDGERPQLVQFSRDRPPVRTPVSPPAGPGRLGALLTLFALWSARNTPERRAIFEFNARQYLVDPSGELSRANVERLNRDQVGNVCRRLGEVQSDTDKAANTVIRNGGLLLSPQQRGTAIHKELENLINGRNEAFLHAEVSRLKSREVNADYGTKGSVRIDVLEYAGEGTTCVYDIKTGTDRRSGLTPARMKELAEHAIKAYPNTRRIIVTEIRLSR